VRPATPPGVAGVSVFEVPAAERGAAHACLRTPAGRPFVPAAGRPQLALLVLGGDVVDEVLVVDRGGAGLELHTHGAPAVAAALRRAFPCSAAPDDAPAAAPAAALLRRALSAEQLDLALEQLAAPFPDFLQELAAAAPAARAAPGAAALGRSAVAMALAAPARVVLAGAQNAGKSSLFNRLLYRERALTGALPGLTRDPVAELTVLAGYPYELVDTAGEGPAGLPAAAAAIAAGRELRDGAFVVLVVDRARGPGDADRRLLARADLVVANKTDLPGAPWPAWFRCDLQVACATMDGAALRARFGAALRRLRGLPAAGPVGGPAALDREQLAALAALLDRGG